MQTSVDNVINNNSTLNRYYLQISMYFPSSDLMLNCWKMESRERPTFSEIKKFLEDLIEKEMPHAGYIKLDDFKRGELFK